jgi:hypothetical protein
LHSNVPGFPLFTSFYYIAVFSIFGVIEVQFFDSIKLIWCHGVPFLAVFNLSVSSVGLAFPFRLAGYRVLIDAIVLEASLIPPYAAPPIATNSASLVGWWNVL